MFRLRRTGPRAAALAVGLMAAVLLAGAGTGGASVPPGATPVPSAGAPVTASPTGDGGTGLGAVRLPPGIRYWSATLEYGGVRRSYLVLAPTGSVAGLPLIVGLHGRNATPAQEASRDDLIPLAASGKAVLVYPTGWGQSWNIAADGCCGPAASDHMNDVGFVSRVVDQVRAQLQLSGPTDLVGYSNGGRLAFTIACQDPSRYQAVATVSATPAISCPDAAPLPLIAIVNADDTTLPGAAGDPVGALNQTATWWGTRNHCRQPPAQITAGTATVRSWNGCALQTVVYRAGIGHDWPGEAATGVPGAAQLIWTFFTSSTR